MQTRFYVLQPQVCESGKVQRQLAADVFSRPSADRGSEGPFLNPACRRSTEGPGRVKRTRISRRDMAVGHVSNVPGTMESCPTLASHRNPKRKRGHTLLRIAPNPSLTLRVTILKLLQGFRAEAALSDQPRKSFLPDHSLPSSSLVTQGLPSSVWGLGDAVRSGASRTAVPKLELGNENRVAANADPAL